MRKLIAIGAVVLSGAGILAGCSEDYKGLGDAGIGTRLEARREVIIMPDKFANVAMACDGHGHRVYVTTRGNATPQVVPDPSCGGPQ